MGLATPMERYFLGCLIMYHVIHHRLAGYVTNFLREKNIDDAEYVKDYMLCNEDNLIFTSGNVKF
jgi:hypothetical protein